MIASRSVVVNAAGIDMQRLYTGWRRVRALPCLLGVANGNSNVMPL